MTPGEIEKAADKFAMDEYPDYIYGMCHPTRNDLRRGVIHGAELANKYWQEKTRWIPVEERLPKPLPFENGGKIANGDLLLVKHIGYGSIEFGLLREVNNVKYWELPDCGNFEINEISHWKEID